jgi:hypothetical protein
MKTTFQNTFGVVNPTLSVTISGPGTVVTAGSKTWAANASGGTTYTYSWAFRPHGSSTWYTVGSQQSYVTNVTALDNPGFDLRATVTSGGVQGQTVKHVSVLIESGGGCGGGPC